MKKLFFFKSASSSGSNGNAALEKGSNDQPGDTDEYSFLSPRRQITDSSSYSNSPCLRRSRSLSSAGFLVDGLGQQEFPSSNDQNRSPNITPQSYDQSSRRRTLTPERRYKGKRCEATVVAIGSSRMQHDSSGSSSPSSSNVVDRYIDGEQLQESSKSKHGSKRHNLGNGGGRLPPRVQYTAPSSSSDRVENGFGHESARMIAKNVIERLSQTHVPRSSCSKEFDLHVPITAEDIYGGYLSRCTESKLDEPYENDIGYHEEDTDVELQRRSKEAEERVVHLYEALEQDSHLRDIGFNVSSLIETNRHLTEDKIDLALEVSNLLRSRIAERARAREESEARTKKLEAEKYEIQLALEKELDRRSSSWSSKLEKYRFEEERLRERVRELAEQNVSLQREVTSFNEKETETRTMITYSAEQLKEMTRRAEKLNDENQDLKKNLSDSQEKHRAVTEDIACVRRNFEEKDNECKELHKSVARLYRTCCEQEKTIEGLREGYGHEIENKQSRENNENRLKILQREQMRLTGVESVLRRELESCRHEVDSLRHENIDLLNRLKGNGKDTFKLDKEIRTRVGYLQDQGLSMLNESTRLSSELIEFIKGKTSQLQETQRGLDAQFIVESDMTVQCFKRGIESLTRSLQMISTLLQEKSNPIASEPHSEFVKLENQSSEEILRTKLKSETLLTNLLREKLYSNELEVEKLQAELAAAVRGNDILRCEVQNAMDNVSCLTHRLKDLELQERFDEPRSRFHSKRLSTSIDVNVYDDNPKIVKTDTLKTRSRSHRFNVPLSNYGDDFHYQTIPSSLLRPVQARASLPSHQILDDFKCFTGGDECRFSSAHNTPRFANAHTTPTKSVCGDEYFRPYSNCPGYMMKTQSFRAKLRSCSAPKQRPESRVAKKMLSLNEIMAARNSMSSVRMNKSCYQVQECLETLEVQNFHFSS